MRSLYITRAWGTKNIRRRSEPSYKLVTCSLEFTHFTAWLGCKQYSQLRLQEFSAERKEIE